MQADATVEEDLPTINIHLGLWKWGFVLVVAGWALVTAACAGFVIGVTYGKASIKIENYQGQDLMMGASQQPESSAVVVPNVSIPKAKRVQQ